MKAWALRQSEADKFIMWLRGPVGSGKTCIAWTFAQWCYQEGILVSHFFFSREDSAIDLYKHLVPTLAYRMAFDSCTGTQEAISKAINKDPHIFAATLDDQIKEIILEPLDIASLTGTTPHVIVFDGLDEILTPYQQVKLINVFSTSVYAHNPALRILISSRPEPTIMALFDFPDDGDRLVEISTVVSLDYEPDSVSDVRHFLAEKLDAFSKQLPSPPETQWPAPADLDQLAAMSSGQFIYAAAVMKYVCSTATRHEAVQKLQCIVESGSQHPSDGSYPPFADLDALYTEFLKTKHHLSVKAMAICLQYPKYLHSISPDDLGRVLAISPNRTWSILYGLASLLDVTDEEIKFFHPFFGDFLFDRSRSSDFYVNEADIVTDITCTVLNACPYPQSMSCFLILFIVDHRFLSLFVLDLSCSTLFRLLSAANPRQDLTDILSRMQPSLIFGSFPAFASTGGSYYLISLLKVIEKHVVGSFSLCSCYIVT